MRKSGRPAGRNGCDFGKILIRRSVGHFAPNPPVRFLGIQQPRFGRFGPRKPKPARDVVLGPNPPKGGADFARLEEWPGIGQIFRKFAKMRIFAKSGEKIPICRNVQIWLLQMSKTRVWASFQKRLCSRGFANRKKLKSSAEKRAAGRPEMGAILERF